MRQLILGGARSGKSLRALRLAEETAMSRLFIATAEAFDAEMTERIEKHRLERGPGWITQECPLDLPAAISTAPSEHGIIVIDCLTVWLGNLLHHQRHIDTATDALCAAISGADKPLIFVSNEVGMGLVPETAMGRAFRDHQGRLNQRVAALCERVEFVVAGLPLQLKG